MKFLLFAVMLAGAAVSTGSAQTSPPEVELLDRLTGSWILEGTIDGKTTTHDVDVKWVLNEQYVELHEVSRERDARGRPEYEAIVYLTWEPSRGEVSCLWLDSTSNAGLSNGVLGRAKPTDDELRLLFTYADGSTFHTTFAYDRKVDTWQWKMDGEEQGQLIPFARVQLRHK
ncbi:MAG: hypothetical protein IPH48_17710 [bacterium]|jgi:hypothetical protein|nr:hypothetical protein [bacterium]